MCVEYTRGARGIFPDRACLVIVLAGAVAALGQSGARAPAGWQNPDIGLVVDFVADLHDAQGELDTWRSQGLRLRGAELVLSANVDPFASLHGNILAIPEGAEMHEAYAVFPYLPGGVKARLGLMQADFGRWNRFHAHFLPFVSEPRLYHEYLGGPVLSKGLEASWLAPLDHFVELTALAYEAIEGHSHDALPLAEPQEAGGRSLDDVAQGFGCVAHGGHWDCPGGRILEEEDLLALSDESREPTTRRDQFAAEDLAVGGRMRTSFEFGTDWSLDAGLSGLYQHGYKPSRRLNRKYPKAIYGMDLTFFWHPPERNRYRNADLSLEWLMNSEMFERAEPGVIHSEAFHRGGLFAHFRYRRSERWEYGAFGEYYQARSGADNRKGRYGAFLTFAPSHYQFLRLEISRFRHAANRHPLHRLALQYDATIGYHGHGNQR